MRLTKDETEGVGQRRLRSEVFSQLQVQLWPLLGLRCRQVLRKGDTKGSSYHRTPNAQTRRDPPTWHLLGSCLNRKLIFWLPLCLWEEWGRVHGNTKRGLAFKNTSGSYVRSNVNPGLINPWLIFIGGLLPFSGWIQTTFGGVSIFLGGVLFRSCTSGAVS